MKVRQRKAANRYQGVQINTCPACNAPVQPHRACEACGMYNGKQVLNIEN